MIQDILKELKDEEKIAFFDVFPVFQKVMEAVGSPQRLTISKKEMKAVHILFIIFMQGDKNRLTQLVDSIKDTSFLDTDDSILEETEINDD